MIKLQQATQSSTAPYSRDAFIGMLKCRGIRQHSHSWVEYELGKAIIQNLEDNEPGQSEYYDRYLSFLTNWIYV